ncbi:MAG: hypothetical protein AAGA81_15655, partial [Acidobacteriota bacterium]
MLIKRAVLDRIESGEIDLIYRKWRKPTVKARGQLRTQIGMLDIVAVEQIAKSRITSDDASRAGFDSKAALVRELDGRDGEIYRIEVRYGGEDPRIALRENADLSAEDIAELQKRLARLDRASKRGPWTTTFLHLLNDNPHVRAPDLAAGL